MTTFGKSGIEYVFEKYLKGTDGVKQIDMAVDGTVTDEYIEEEAISGSDVVLTIDSNLQKTTEKALSTAISELRKNSYDSTFGAAVVMNVNTGEILAMASYPTYDPSVFIGGVSDSDWADIMSKNKLRSIATQGFYAPGSTFKMVTGIAALETGAVTSTETVRDTGVYPLGHNPVCWYYTRYRTGHGWLNITSAIQKSCNYFFYEMGYRIGIDTLEKYARYFGLGSKTGVELPNETSGVLASKDITDAEGKTWYVSDTLSASIGQSYNSFSPLQMARYVSILANGGNRINPTIIKTIIGADGTEVSKTEIEEYVNELLGLSDEDVEDLNLSSKNIKVILEGMRLVANSSRRNSIYSI